MLPIWLASLKLNEEIMSWQLSRAPELKAFLLLTIHAGLSLDWQRSTTASIGITL
jgi:hypothetical protein